MCEFILAFAGPIPTGVSGEQKAHQWSVAGVPAELAVARARPFRRPRAARPHGGEREFRGAPTGRRDAGRVRPSRRRDDPPFSSWRSPSNFVSRGPSTPAHSSRNNHQCVPVRGAGCFPAGRALGPLRRPLRFQKPVEAVRAIAPDGVPAR